MFLQEEELNLKAIRDEMAKKGLQSPDIGSLMDKEAFSEKRLQDLMQALARMQASDPQQLFHDEMTVAVV